MSERGYQEVYAHLKRQLASPPPGWFTFGSHDDPGQGTTPDLEFWGDDGGGMPLWERPKTTYKVREEWRVTGDPGHGYPSYDFVFGSNQRRAMALDIDPESAARVFVAGIRAYPAGHQFAWADGPHLRKRTIKESDWEEVTE